MNVTVGPDDPTVTNTTEEQPSAWALSEFSLLCFTLCLILIIVLGVVGNFLVIYVSIRTTLNRGPTSTIDVYIFHLSIADFLFLLFCVPFQGTVYIFNDWPYGLALCKVAYFCQSVTMYASIWILALMSVDRYIAIGHPLKSVKWRTVERATRISIAVWTISIMMSLPYLMLYKTIDYPASTVCYDDWPSDMYDCRKWSILFVFFVTFLLPTVVIFCMALLVCAAIHSSVHQPLLRAESTAGQGDGKTPHRRRRRRVVWLVFALSLVQLICWCPHSVTLVWLNFDRSAWEWVEDNSWTYFVMNIVNHMGTYLHSCINPVLYSLASEQFRVRLVNAFKRRDRRSPSASMAVNCYYGPAGNTLTPPIVIPKGSPKLSASSAMLL